MVTRTLRPMGRRLRPAQRDGRHGVGMNREGHAEQGSSQHAREQGLGVDRDWHGEQGGPCRKHQVTQHVLMASSSFERGAHLHAHAGMTEV